MENRNNDKKTQLLMLMYIVLAGGLSLSEEKIQDIIDIIVSAQQSSGKMINVDSIQHGETVHGMAGLAKIIGVSIPTACKLNKSGRFDAARLDFGTRKFVWDKAKLMEIVKKK